MCGIAGILDSNIEKKELVIKGMVDAITHRGPDDDGFFVDKNLALGMRRLAIIDLSTGRQPVTSMDGKLVIIFNGEIYNYKELKEELLKKGSVFKTNSDTEVILSMYEMYGEKMLTKLRGMFTFCIYNTETKQVFIARDFFGIKPLYYLIKDQQILAFSSEIKSFLSFPDFKPEVNDSAVLNYLSFQYNPLSKTFFKNVYRLPPGHFLSIDTQTNKTEIKKYWSFGFDQNPNLEEKPTAKKIYDVVEDSVKHHMIADVPVGAFLSGGIDSSVITTLMQKIREENPSSREKLTTEQGKIKTFTVGFENLSEGKEARETSNFLGTDHTEITIGPEEYFEILPKIVYHFDEPVADPSAVGLYFVAREARKQVKVVLSGEGADELFGGYNIYLTPIDKAKMAWIPKSLLDILKNLPFEYYGKNYLRRVSMKLEDWYIGQKYFNGSIFTRDEINKLWKEPKDFLSLKPLYKQVANLSESTQMQYIDINTWLIGDILAKADKMTMANSLELRVPFLDTEVANIAKSLPDSFKWRRGVTKYLLREAFRKIVPESTRNRRKLGFPVPIKDWLTKDRSDVYKTILENDYIKKHMEIGYINNIINSHLSKKTDNSRKIYLLLMLALWYDRFIGSDKSREIL